MRARGAKWGLLLVLASGCEQGHRSEQPITASEAEASPATSGSEAAVLQRPRFTYVPRAYPAARVAASKIGLELIDKRPNVHQAQLMMPAMAVPQDGEAVEVALPADYPALVQDRLAKLVSGSGPELKLIIEVRRLAASRTGDVRRLDVDLGVTVQDANGNPLVRGGGQANKELTGPAYDGRELDDLHRAACADAVDTVLASESNIELINSYLVGH